MKKTMISCALLLMAMALMSADKKDGTMVKEKGVYIVNTTTLGKDVKGYNGPTPLKVYIKSGKIEKVEFLENEETPKYWRACVDHIKNKWDGMTVKDAKTKEVDGRTGATYSSDAVKKNVKLAVEYYEKNK
ncbi:MAG: FMN-binding protein [Prevotella sp.]|jgi:electron transport complex protein RnfG|nr:FMN-binding protein [Prevotella sp.]MBR6997570.1 FMN-binding protein [Prevotella sp.]